MKTYVMTRENQQAALDEGCVWADGTTSLKYLDKAAFCVENKIMRYIDEPTNPIPIYPTLKPAGAGVFDLLEFVHHSRDYKLYRGMKRVTHMKDVVSHIPCDLNLINNTTYSSSTITITDIGFEVPNHIRELFIPAPTLKPDANEFTDEQVIGIVFNDDYYLGSAYKALVHIAEGTHTERDITALTTLIARNS